MIKGPEITTPLLYIDGPNDLKVEEWGESRGYKTFVKDPSKNTDHIYAYVFIRDGDEVKAVVALYQGEFPPLPFCTHHGLKHHCAHTELVFGSSEAKQ